MRLLGEGGGVPTANRTVADIAERDALSGNLPEGALVTVLDASGDPTVSSGPATYVWDGSSFVKVAESEGLDQTVAWDDISGRPTSAVPDIDDAVGKRHEHGQPLADIDDAATKRHEHGQPLADIDDAALKRHTHQDSDADIHAAVVQRHTHQDSDADIHDAVLQRHTHGQPLADIDDAALKRHEHANKNVLDLFSMDSMGLPLFDGKPIVTTQKDVETMFVAPDAASRQPGDIDVTGYAGIRKALYLAARFVEEGYNKLLYIRLRPGVYVCDGNVLSTSSAMGNGIVVMAHSGPNLPAAADYTFSDRDADAQTLRNAYDVRIEFDHWALAYADFQRQLWFRNILFESTNVGNGTVFRATRGGFIRAEKCSVIGARYRGYVDINAGFYDSNGGHSIMSGQTSSRVYACHHGGHVYVIQGANASSTSVHAWSHALADLTNGASAYISGYGSAPERMIVRKMTGNVLQAQYGAALRVYKLDVRNSYRYSYTLNADFYTLNCLSRTTRQVIYAVHGSRITISQHNFPPNSDPAIARRIYAYGNSIVNANEGSFAGGDPDYSPALGTAGNKGARIL